MGVKGIAFGIFKAALIHAAYLKDYPSPPVSIRGNEACLDGVTEGLYFIGNSKILYCPLATYNFSNSSK